MKAVLQNAFKFQWENYQKFTYLSEVLARIFSDFNEKFLAVQKAHQSLHATFFIEWFSQKFLQNSQENACDGVLLFIHRPVMLLIKRIHHSEF